jgi:transcription elongation factor GreA-like protein
MTNHNQSFYSFDQQVNVETSSSSNSSSTTATSDNMQKEIESRDQLIANLKEQYQELSALNMVLYQKLDSTMSKFGMLMDGNILRFQNFTNLFHFSKLTIGSFFFHREFHVSI